MLSHEKEYPYVHSLGDGFLFLEVFEPLSPSFDISKYIATKKKDFFLRKLLLLQCIINVNSIILVKAHRVFDKSIEYPFSIIEIQIGTLTPLFSPCQIEVFEKAMQETLSHARISLN